MQDEIPFWVHFDGTEIPKNALVFGSYHQQNYYIGRASHNRSLTPGIVLENDKVCIIPWVRNKIHSFFIQFQNKFYFREQFRMLSWTLRFWLVEM